MVSMMKNPIRLEKSEFGTRAILTTCWSKSAHEEIIKIKPDELELNTSKGWWGRDISFLQDYQWLKSFIIIDMGIDDISPIHYLKKLQNIDIVTYCKTNIDFSYFDYLYSCGIEWRNGCDSIFECKNLTDLFLNRYKGKSSAPFGNLTRLKKLGILNASLSELYHFSNLNRLSSLRIGVLRSLKSLDGLEALSQLKSFTMTSCRSVTTLAPLYDLKSLIEINVSNNGELDTIKPLAALPNLRSLLFYEKTNIVDGDLQAIFENPVISKIAFQNRRHYSHKCEEFGSRCER